VTTSDLAASGTGRAVDDIAPRSVLLKVPRIRSGHFGTHYDVSPDGRRIYFLDRKTDPPPPDFNVVLGWPGILK
jgi:hypothetical protein